MEDIRSSASAMYDGGWRSTDRDDIMSSYDLTEEEADQICEVLKEYEEEWKLENKDIRVLMADHCTEAEAKKHLDKGTLVLDNVADYIQSQIDSGCYDGETDDDIRNGKVKDVSMVELDGHEYVVVYCL
jgi:hypothetical protein